MRLVVSRAALSDVQRLHQFLSAYDVAAARRAVDILDGAMHSLLSFPERGRPSGVVGVRELIVPFGASAYIVRYAHLAERSEIVILRLWHGREERV